MSSSDVRPEYSNYTVSIDNMSSPRAQRNSSSKAQFKSDVVVGLARTQFEDTRHKNPSFNAKSKMSEATESTASSESFVSSRSKLSSPAGNLVGLSVLGSGTGNQADIEYRRPEYVVAEYDDEDDSSSSDDEDEDGEDDDDLGDYHTTYDDEGDQNVFHGEYHQQRPQPSSRHRPPPARKASSSKPFNSNSTMSSNSSSDIQARMMAQAAMNSQLAAELMESHDAPFPTAAPLHRQTPSRSHARTDRTGSVREVVQNPLEFTVSRSHLEVPEYELNGRALSELHMTEMSSREGRTTGKSKSTRSRGPQPQQPKQQQLLLHASSVQGQNVSFEDYEESIRRARSMASASTSDDYIIVSRSYEANLLDDRLPRSQESLDSDQQFTRHTSTRSGGSSQRRSSFGSTGIEPPTGRPETQKTRENDPRQSGEDGEISWSPPPCFGAPVQPPLAPAEKKAMDETAARASFTRQFGMENPSVAFNPHDVDANFQQFDVVDAGVSPAVGPIDMRTSSRIQDSTARPQIPIEDVDDDIVSTVSGMVERDVFEEDDLSVISDITGMTGFTSRPEEVDEDDTLQNRPGRFAQKRRIASESQKEVEASPPIQSMPKPRKLIASREVHEPHGIPAHPKLKKVTPALGSKHRSKLHLRVSFGDVQIRLYERTISINPAVTSGPAIGIGWRYQSPSYVYRVHDIEDERESVRRPSSQLVLSKRERVEILESFGFSASDIAEGTRLSLRGKNQRRKTLINLESKGASDIEELVESTARKVKKLFSLSSKRRKSKVKGDGSKSVSSNNSSQESFSQSQSQSNFSNSNLSNSTSRRSSMKGFK